MDTLTTHPSTAQQAKAFTSPASLSFPGGATELTPPSSEAESYRQLNGVTTKNGVMDGRAQANSQGGVIPATPAATPGAAGAAGAAASGILPTLQ